MVHLQQLIRQSGDWVYDIEKASARPRRKHCCRRGPLPMTDIVGEGQTEPQNVEQGISNDEVLQQTMDPSAFDIPCSIFDIQTASCATIATKLICTTVKSAATSSAAAQYGRR